MRDILTMISAMEQGPFQKPKSTKVGYKGKGREFTGPISSDPKRYGQMARVSAATSKAKAREEKGAKSPAALAGENKHAFGYFLDLHVDAPGFSLARVFKSI